MSGLDVVVGSQVSLQMRVCFCLNALRRGPGLSSFKGVFHTLGKTGSRTKETMVGSSVDQEAAVSV